MRRHRRKTAALLLPLALFGCASPGRLDVRARADAVEASDFGQAIAQGDALRGRGEFALAVDHYRRALRLRPDDARALTSLASCYDGIGRHDLGRRYHELALAVAPDSEQTVMEFARSLARQGQIDAAAALIDDFRIAGAEASRAALVALAPVAPVVAPDPAPAPSEPAELPRLERRDAGVVALVTRAPPSPVRVATGSSLVIQLDPPTPAPPALVVVNAVGREGQAGRLSRYLAARGWRARPRDTTTRLAVSQLRYATGLETQAQRLRKALPFPVALIRAGQPGVQLMLGVNAVPFDDRLRRRRT